MVQYEEQICLQLICLFEGKVHVVTILYWLSCGYVSASASLLPGIFTHIGIEKG